MNVKIKICGITSGQEAAYLNENSVDFAGMVLFFPKSRRNIDIPKAKNIMSALNSSIKKVAVVVSPTLHQVEEIYAAGLFRFTVISRREYRTWEYLCLRHSM